VKLGSYYSGNGSDSEATLNYTSNTPIITGFGLSDTTVKWNIENNDSSNSETIYWTIKQDNGTNNGTVRGSGNFNLAAGASYADSIPTPYLLGYEAASDDTYYTMYAYAVEYTPSPDYAASATVSHSQQTEHDPDEPTVEYKAASRTSSSLTWNFTNNDTIPVDLFYSHGTSPSTPTTAYSGNPVAAGVTVEKQFTSLVQNTTYTCKLRSETEGNYSSIVEDSQATSQVTTAAPTVSLDDEGKTSLVYDVTNNDGTTATMSWEFKRGATSLGSGTFSLGNGDSWGDGRPYGLGSDTLYFDSLTNDTTYTLYVSAQASGEASSGTISSSGTTEHSPATPTITYTSKNTTSITFNIKNNDASSCTMYYDDGDTTPTVNGFTLAAGATVSKTLSSLSPNTSYTISTRAKFIDNYGSAASITQTTYHTPSTPTITFVGTTSSTVSFTIKNNDVHTLTAYYGTSSNPTGNGFTLVSGATSTTKTISSLSNSNAYNIYAQVGENGYYSSDASFYVPKAPTITHVTTTAALGYISMKAKNNDSHTGSMHLEDGDSTPETSIDSSVAYNTYSSTKVFSSLSSGTHYFYARFKYNNIYSLTSNSTSFASTYGNTTTKPYIPAADYLNYGSFYSVEWRVQNKDTDGVATIYTELGDSTPDLETQSNVAYNAYTSYFEAGEYYSATAYTLYAKATVAGQVLSAYYARSGTTPSVSGPEFYWAYVAEYSSEQSGNVNMNGTASDWQAAQTDLTSAYDPNNYGYGDDAV